MKFQTLKKIVLVDGNKITSDWYRTEADMKEFLRFNSAGLFAPKAKQSVMAGGYATSVQVTDGDTAFNTAAKVYALAQVAAGVTARIWEHSIPPRYFKVWGSGTYGAINNQGYLWLAMLKAGTGFQSNRIALGVETYDRHNKVVVDEFQDADVHLATATSLATATPSNNQTNMRSLPQTTIVAGPYSRLYIDTTVLAAQAGMDALGFSIPVTAKSG
jgi:hypothetical protein